MIAWILWALKIAGLTAITYSTICWITLGLLVVKTCIDAFVNWAKAKTSK